MSGLLPPQMRCSAWWYAQHRGLPVSMGYLKSLGLTAARMARWEGLEEWRVPERHPDGVTYLVCQWPERIWDAASVQPAAREAEFWSCPPPPEGTMAYDDWTRMAEEDLAWRGAPPDPYRDDIPGGSYPGWANPYD